MNYEFWDKGEVINQGRRAYLAGFPIDSCVYKHTPLSRHGEMKRAYWEKGWRDAQKTSNFRQG